MTKLATLTDNELLNDLLQCITIPDENAWDELNSLIDDYSLKTDLARLNTLRSRGKHLLEIAACNGHPNTLNYLMNDLGLAYPSDAKQTLDYWLLWNPHFSPEAFLTENLNALLKATMPDLHYAVFMNDYNSVKSIVESSPESIQSLDTNGCTALFYATSKEQNQIITLIKSQLSYDPSSLKQQDSFNRGQLIRHYDKALNLSQNNSELGEDAPKLKSKLSEESSCYLQANNYFDCLHEVSEEDYRIALNCNAQLATISFNTNDLKSAKKYWEQGKVYLAQLESFYPDEDMDARDNDIVSQLNSLDSSFALSNPALGSERSLATPSGSETTSCSEMSAESVRISPSFFRPLQSLEIAQAPQIKQNKKCRFADQI